MSQARPFVFFGCIEFREILGRRARAYGRAGASAPRIRHLLSNPQRIRKMGEAGREHVRQNFLITRHLRDYLSLLIHLTR